MTSPLSPEAVAQMVADLDLFSRCGDVGVMDRDMAIDAKAMLTTLAAENATLRDDLAETEALEMQHGAVIERLTAENATLRQERRMIISHATMGTTDGDGLSLNAVSVQITQLRNELYNDAKAGAEAELATLRASEAAAQRMVRVLSDWLSEVGVDLAPQELRRRLAALTPTADKE